MKGAICLWPHRTPHTAAIAARLKLPYLQKKRRRSAHSALKRKGNSDRHGTPMQSEGSASDTVTVAGNSEFFQAISGRKSAEMWAVMGELMDTLQAINPRLYNSVLRKINN